VDVGLIDVFAVGAVADLAFAGVASGFGRFGVRTGRFLRWLCGQDG